MQDVATTGARSEPQFAALVDAIATDPDRREQLTDLLREDHPLYDQRGTATTVRMRGWVLLALARAGVSDAALIFVLEELDTGVDAYLVAAAARALRSYPRPTAAFAPFVMRALTNIRYRDEPVSFENYGEYAVSSTGTSPVRELLTTLGWLGPHARGVLRELESLRAQRGGLSKKRLIDVDRAVEAIRGAHQVDELGTDTCCTLPSGLGNTFSWALSSRRGCERIESTIFEDHKGELITFKEFFRGHPSIVIFFYTRCDNPLKCSLTVTKLARIQKLLEARRLADQIHTAAITYDPTFDLPERLRGYGQNRGVRMDAHHRMLRATDGVNALRRHFKLGVNFIEPLVNRHRIEAYILDVQGRIAASFERIHWDEQQVVDRTIEVLREKSADTTSEVSPDYLAALLEAMPRYGAYVFEAPRGRFDNLRFALEEVARRSGVPFCIHDLRRTFATIADSLDIPGYAVKALLNQKSGSDVTAGYVVASVERLRGPMQKITDYVLRCAGVEVSAVGAAVRTREVSRSVVPEQTAPSLASENRVPLPGRRGSFLKATRGGVYGGDRLGVFWLLDRARGMAA